MTQTKVNGTIIELVRGDITNLSTDAIVNAANSQLILGAGVAGAVRRKGGPSIQEECNRLGGTPVGTAVITRGGNLPAKHVIHAVGPRMGDGNEDDKLRNATLSSLKVADENNLRSIAFPAISTGIFGYPLDRCARMMLSVAMDYARGETDIERVVFCLYDEGAFGVFENRLGEMTAVKEQE